MSKNNFWDLEISKWKFSDWIYAIFLLVMFVIIVVLTVNLVSLILKLANLSNWDPLAFVGATVGGLITLFGVLLSIKHQNKKSYIDSLPDKINNANDVIEELREVLNKLNRCTEVVSDSLRYVDRFKLKNLFDGYHNVFNKTRLPAIKTSKMFYKIILEMNSHVMDFRLNYDDLADLQNDISQLQVNILYSKVIELQSSLSFCVGKLRAEMERLMSEYYNYTDN